MLVLRIWGLILIVRIFDCLSAFFYIKLRVFFSHHCYYFVFWGETRVVTVLAEVFMLWATITEGLHRSRNIHHNLETDCATAKTGLFGGAAFLALDAALFWLICMMLTDNARSDYLDNDDPKGTYGQVLATEYDTNGSGGHPA